MSEWNGSNYTDANTGVKTENLFLIYQDTYIMGNDDAAPEAEKARYMGTPEVEVPEKYFTIK